MKMTRSICLATLTLAAASTMWVTFEARQARASILVHEVADNLYMLASDPAEQGMRSGGNTAVFVTTNGVTLVDTKLSGYGQDILAAVRNITDKPVHDHHQYPGDTHFDHTGGNTEFAETVDFVWPMRTNSGSDVTFDPDRPIAPGIASAAAA